MSPNYFLNVCWLCYCLRIAAAVSNHFRATENIRNQTLVRLLHGTRDSWDLTRYPSWLLDYLCDSHSDIKKTSSLEGCASSYAFFVVRVAQFNHFLCLGGVSPHKEYEDWLYTVMRHLFMPKSLCLQNWFFIQAFSHNLPGDQRWFLLSTALPLWGALEPVVQPDAQHHEKQLYTMYCMVQCFEHAHLQFFCKSCIFWFV